jgi:hypothetical protein
MHLRKRTFKKQIQSVVREASDQTGSPRGSQSVRRKTARAENSEPTAFLGRRERFGVMSKGIAGFLCVLHVVYSFSHHP